MSAHNQAQLRKYKQARNRVERSIAQLPRQVGEIAVNFSKDNFQREGFLGPTVDKWPKRKNNLDPGRGLLRQSGRLYRSVRVVHVSRRAVVIGSDVPYALAHNEGFRGRVSQKVRAHTRVGYRGSRQKVSAHTRTLNQRIPRRQFIGPSPYLTNRINRHIGAVLLKSFRIR